MVSLNTRFESSTEDPLIKARKDAEYWRMTLVTEMRLGRKLQWAAFWIGVVFGCGCLCIGYMLAKLWI